MLRNGVDLTALHADRPAPRRRDRLSLSTQARVVASVGRLHPLKGHDLVIEAIAALPDATLLIAGSGPEGTALGKLARRLGVADRVRLLGQLAHDELPIVYSASDVLVLASSHEGWANVLLEAMACGTPVVATNVGGSREIVDAPEAGMIVDAATGRRSPRRFDAVRRAARPRCDAPLRRTLQLGRDHARPGAPVRLAAAAGGPDAVRGRAMTSPTDRTEA